MAELNVSLIIEIQQDRNGNFEGKGTTKVIKPIYYNIC